jgi:glucose dehydrogenase
VETPVLVDGTIDGRPRKLVVQASRNGYFFVLDRATGKQILTKPFIDTLNWAKPNLDAKGQPTPEPAKYPTPDGVLVSPAAGGATNWQAPSFNPETGLLYVSSMRTYSMYYLTDLDPRPQGWAGLDSAVGSDGSALLAIDYKTGKTVWKHEWPGGGGFSHMLSTAGKLLFTHNGQNIIAFEPTNGEILWHSTLMAAPSAGPITYTIDGRQFLLVCAGDSLYAFAVNAPPIHTFPSSSRREKVNPDFADRSPAPPPARPADDRGRRTKFVEVMDCERFALARPKSRIFTRPSSAMMMMFDGFTSRWMMPAGGNTFIATCRFSLVSSRLIDLTHATRSELIEDLIHAQGVRPVMGAFGLSHKVYPQ